MDDMSICAARAEGKGVAVHAAAGMMAQMRSAGDSHDAAARGALCGTAWLPVISTMCTLLCMPVAHSTPCRSCCAFVSF